MQRWEIQLRRRRLIAIANATATNAPGAGIVITEEYPGSWRVDSIPFDQIPSDEYGGPSKLFG